MTTLVAALDDSAAAAPTLRTALGLAELFDADVEALHVIDPTIESTPTTPTTCEQVAAQLGVELHQRRGVPEDEIVAELRRGDVAAGVLGARRSAAGRRPAGHTALAVLQRAAKPVVVVPPDCRPPTDGVLRRVLVPLDGTETTARAVEHTADLFAGRGVDVLALHVFDETTVPRFWDHPEHEPEEFAREFLRRYCRTEGTHLRLRTGDPGEAVLEAAADPEIDLVAMAWSQDLSPGHARTIRQVLAGCCTAMLLLPVDQPRRATRGTHPVASRSPAG
jgi:nucleotide-binding universal stress UspA family protein